MNIQFNSSTTEGSVVEHQPYQCSLRHLQLLPPADPLTDTKIYITKRRLVSADPVSPIFQTRESTEGQVPRQINLPRGWLQLSCGFCVYFPSSSARIVFNSCR